VQGVHALTSVVAQGGGNARRGPASSAPAPGLPSAGTPPDAGTQGSPLAPLPVLAPVLHPQPVLSPLAASATSSLFAHLPMGWFVALAVLDVLLALGIIARRRMAHEASTNTE
jgi:hypothetical protein